MSDAKQHPQKPAKRETEQKEMKREQRSYNEEEDLDNCPG
jgi:hypothetical protein